MAAAPNNSFDTCSICTEKLKKPKLLPCFHSFCLECLQQFVSSSSKDGMFLCPMCLYRVTLPEKGVAGFQTNFYVEAWTEQQIHREDECCGMCEQLASHKCRECEILLCDSCTNYHRGLPVSRAHTLINLSHIDSRSPVLSVQKFCEKHVEEKLRFYCKTCGKVICLHCKFTEHEGHTTKDICDVVEEARKSLLKMNKELKMSKTEIDDKLENMNRNNTSVSETIDESKREVNEFLDSIDEMINGVRCHQIRKLTDVEETQKKRFDDAKETLSQRLCFIQSQIDRSEAMLREGLDCDILITDSEMKQRLTEIQKEQSIGDESDAQSLCILPNSVANSTQLDLVRHSINETMKHAFPGSEKNVFLKTVKVTRHDYRYFIGCITFTKSGKVLIFKPYFNGDKYLCLCDNSVLTSTWKLKVTLDELLMIGVHGVLVKQKKYLKNKIPESDYTDLKKPFPYMDTNDDGDKCSAFREYDVVVIKPVKGDVITLTFNPFAGDGEKFVPVDVCWGKNQDVYIADLGARMIIMYSLHDGFHKSFQSPSGCPITAIVMDREGQLWVGDMIGTIHICHIE